MKVTIEFEENDAAVRALRAAECYSILWDLDGVMRRIVNDGEFRGKQLADNEVKIVEKIYEDFRDGLYSGGISFEQDYR